MITRAHYWTLSWARWIQCIPSYSESLGLILTSHLRIGFPSGLFHSGFLTKISYEILISPTCATCPNHLILDFITLIVFGEAHKSWSSSLLLFGLAWLLIVSVLVLWKTGNRIQIVHPKVFLQWLWSGQSSLRELTVDTGVYPENIALWMMWNVFVRHFFMLRMCFVCIWNHRSKDHYFPIRCFNKSGSKTSHGINVLTRVKAKLSLANWSKELCVCVLVSYESKCNVANKSFQCVISVSVFFCSWLCKQPQNVTDISFVYIIALWAK
jgi:hypothetical protein